MSIRDLPFITCSRPRAGLLRSLGRGEEAAEAYRRALALVANEPERRLAEVERAAE